eukprot:ANDGO_06479.mRNA.1 hypothetical protein
MASLSLWILAQRCGWFGVFTILGYLLGKRRWLVLSKDYAVLRDEYDRVGTELSVVAGQFQTERKLVHSLSIANQQLQQTTRALEVKVELKVQELQARDSHIQQLGVEHQSLQSRIEKLDDTVRERDSTIEAKDKEITECKDAIRSLERSVQDLQLVVSGKDSELKKAAHTIQKAHRINQVFMYTLEKCAPDVARRVADIQHADLAQVENWVASSAMNLAFPPTAAISATSTTASSSVPHPVTSSTMTLAPAIVPA